ncbi:MAG: alpha-glucan phosphorylase [Desulfobacteraceae bacterium 4572_88]|nr:MAG: alpha-glucan phosphorylase [Desulfobacteraceae bacterium 4572_88]
MNNLKTFQVFPNIPKPLAFLEVLSRNIWWCWHHDAIELFRRVNPRLWDKAGRNPIMFSTYLPQKRLEELAKDDSFLAHLRRVKESYKRQIQTPVNHADSPFGKQDTIAYFSMEFGIHESIPLFAGGLGILAGDHLKAVSDTALPLTGVGLLYQQGYFRQFLDQNGWQQEEYPETDFFHLPMRRARDRSGNMVSISVTGPDGDIHADLWKIKVGRVPLYLLNTNIPENSPENREITSRLYVGEQKLRLAQEILLGIGGTRALTAMGIRLLVCHMNEGHSAFASLERLALLMETYDTDISTALQIVPRSTVFTTHTPVAAGHDEFPAELVKPCLLPLTDRMGVTADEILSWGQPEGAGPDAPFSMFVLGVRMAQHCNGVSELHGTVARRMWSHVWPGLPENEVPITHVTNGVHISSWISHENALLFERYIGPEWSLHPSSSDVVSRVDEIYDEELWRAHEMSRSRLIRTCRKLMAEQYGRRNAPRAIMEEIGSVLDPDVLTIGFSRRFATYKRANLLLNDPERFKAILNSDTHPVQIIFAGKAHPRDDEGKGLIEEIVRFAQTPEARHRVVFIEDYDIHMARHLVHGADVWLNTPRRPLEACGTSGMKAAINGVLNLSVLDGWWCEGYAEDRGWRIGNGEEYADSVYQDAVESQAIYNILENDVIPCFYERKNGGVPSRWIQMMKASMKMGMRLFCSHRMVREYESRFYHPAAKRYHSLVAAGEQGNAREAENLGKQMERLRQLWQDIRIHGPVVDTDGPFRVGETFRVTTKIFLGELRPDEVEVEFYYGTLKSPDVLIDGHAEQMNMSEDLGDGRYSYAGVIECRFSGRYGFTVRVTPRGDGWLKFTPGFITWA